MLLRNFVDKVRRYGLFQKEEWHGFLITVFILSIIFSFDEWGTAKFDVTEGFANLLLAVIIVFFSVFVHHAAQRAFALWYGFRPEHILWWQGLTFAGLITVFTNGVVKLFPGSALMIHHLPTHRLGFYRYGLNFKSFASIAAVGPGANLVLAGILRIVGEFIGLPAEFVEKAYFFNLLFAGFNALPIPPLDGSRVFYGSRLLYVFVFSSVAAFIVLSLLAGIRSFILAIVIGGLCWLLYYIFFEHGWLFG